MKESKNESPMRRSSLLDVSSGPFAFLYFKRLKDDFSVNKKKRMNSFEEKLQSQQRNMAAP